MGVKVVLERSRTCVAAKQHGMLCLKVFSWCGKEAGGLACLQNNTECYVCRCLGGARKKQDLRACETKQDVMFVGF